MAYKHNIDLVFFISKKMGIYFLLPYIAFCIQYGINVANEFRELTPVALLMTRILCARCCAPWKGITCQPGASAAAPWVDTHDVCAPSMGNRINWVASPSLKFYAHGAIMKNCQRISRMIRILGLMGISPINAAGVTNDTNLMRTAHFLVWQEWQLLLP